LITNLSREALQLISPIYFFANSWFLSDSEDTEERYGVMECHGKDSQIHVPHCFIYFFGAKPFSKPRKKTKKMHGNNGLGKGLREK